jgi:hypothetical protein
MLYLFSMRGDFYTAPSRALFALAVLALLANIVYGNQFMDTFQVKFCPPPIFRFLYLFLQLLISICCSRALNLLMAAFLTT